MFKIKEDVIMDAEEMIGKIKVKKTRIYKYPRPSWKAKYFTMRGWAVILAAALVGGAVGVMMRFFANR